MSYRVLAAILVLGCSAAFAEAPLYKIENLDAVPGYPSWAYYPFDINSNGDVVGWMFNSLSPSAAFIYTPEAGIEALPSSMTEAYAINDSRQIAGRTGGNAYSNGKLLDYTTGEWEAMGTLGGPRSTGYGINNAGTVVGSAELSEVSNGYYITHPVSYANGSLNDLGILPGGNQASAEAINKGGTVVGSSRITDAYNSPWHAFKKRKNGSLTDLGTLGGLSSYANDINDANQIVGVADTSVAGERHAFLYAQSTMQDLGTLGGEDSVATAINAGGVVVGYAHDSAGTDKPFVWVDGVMYDLTSRIVNASEWGDLGAAIGINDSGVIVGRGEFFGGASSSVSRVYKLTPVTQVEVDVLPRDSANVVYPNRIGKLPVAVLSSASFDATQVDPATLRFGSARAAKTGPAVISNVDGLHGNDTTVKFKIEETGIFCDDTEVMLSGETYAGEELGGIGAIDASNCEAGSCHVY
jgi:probable HAF family extracellular repeat protein